MTGVRENMLIVLSRIHSNLQESGTLNILCKASNEKGEVQPFAQDIKWNHGGYKYNGIDEVTVEVVA